MIEKPSIVITSLGRTGTRFFSTLFVGIIPEGTALHEPDILNLGQGRGKEVVRQIQEAGVSNFLIRKPLGHWSLVKLSDKRVMGKISCKGAVKQVLSQRHHFVATRPGKFYIESNLGYYGLADVLPKVYRHHCLIYIVRHPYDWVRSVMSWGTMYNKGKFRSWVAHTWPTSMDFADDPYRERWESMSRFERVCWSWSKLNGYGLKTVSKNPNARIVRFEDVFKSENRYDYLEKLVEFATTFPELGPINIPPLDGWLDKQIHQSEDRFPEWDNWTEQQKKQFATLCEPVMTQFGY